MIEKIELILSIWAQKHRLALWILLLLLTATILLTPFELPYEYHVIAGTHVFGTMLPFFGAVYYTWFAVLLLLLFSGGRNSEWQRIALVCLFALAFFGIWVINTPNGQGCDVVMHMGHVNYILNTGRIVFGNPNVGYFEAPTLHLHNAALSLVSGMGVFETKSLYLLFSGVFQAALLYLLFSKLLKNSYLASIAVLVAIQGGFMTSSQGYWPGNISHLLFITILVGLLVWRGNTVLPMLPLAALPMSVLFMSFAMSYSATPLYFAFILVGIYLVQRVAKKRVVNILIICLFVVMFLLWQMNMAFTRFEGLSELLPQIFKGFLNPEEIFSRVLAPGQTYLGGSTPLWASVVRLFWLVLAVGVGSGLTIWNLAKAKKLDSTGVFVTGAILGAAGLSILCALAIPLSQGAQWGRFLWVAPLFTVPLMLKFLSGFSTSGWFGRHILTLLIISLFVVSLPTFLIQHHEILTDTIRSYERSALEFSLSAYGDNEDLSIGSTHETVVIYSGFFPQANLYRAERPRHIHSRETLYYTMNKLVDDFEFSTARTNIFVLGQRFSPPHPHPLAIQPSDPRWVEFVHRFDKSDKAYNNGHVEIFQR
ncbi:hypothetical protein ACFLXO_06865 [Chloroflexota bacterium]